MKQDYAEGKKILVVEDESVISRVCVKTLTRLGFEVDVATNGLIAKDMVTRKVYGLFFSDIRTPGVNGVEFYQHLKEEQPELADRVIFATGDVMGIEVKAFLAELNNTSLPKPFTPDELKEAVREVLE